MITTTDQMMAHQRMIRAAADAGRLTTRERRKRPIELPEPAKKRGGWPLGKLRGKRVNTWIDKPERPQGFGE